MSNKLNSLRLRLRSQLSNLPYKYILMAIALPLVIFSLDKILQPLELAIYDFNFLIRPPEATDERVVIVEWDEKSIQILEETTISDDTLLALLNKIKQQQPRIIGLDLYRDIPVLSPRLSDAQNIQAYNSLNQLFRSTDNLIGIEKVVEPTINAPVILKQQEQVAASDISSDRDDIIRRTYIFPQIDESGAPAGIPYLGVALGYQYLESQGWTAEQLGDHSLKITNGQSSVTVKPAKTFNSDRYGLDTLVNWRKGNPSFRQVSATEVISNQIPPDLFRDRIVLIGNMSASTADRHNLLLDRWNNSWSYGVQIPAHVASSIVSAAEERRPLIQVASKSFGLTLAAVVALLMIALIDKHRRNDDVYLYLITFIYAVGLTLLLVLLNLIAFAVGWWLQIATAIGVIWVAYISINYYIYQENKRKNVLKLEMFIRDLQHSLGNPLNSIASSTNRIQISVQEIEEGSVGSKNNGTQPIFRDTSSHSATVMEPEQHSLGYLAQEDIRTKLVDSAQHLAIVQKRAINIEKQVFRMERYRKRTEDFINFGYLNKTNVLESTDINQFVSSIVARFEQENEYDYQIHVQQDYDPRLKPVEIDRAAIEIVLENLLDNASYAVAPRNDYDAGAKPLSLIKVQTRQNKRTIEFKIEDNGVGIPPVLRKKIFQPFVSFNYRQGIGLYLTKKILGLYRGKIRVESEEGRGSKFIVTIPAKLSSESKQ